MTFCSSSKVAVFSLLTIDVDLCLNMSEDLNQIYCRRSLDMNLKKPERIEALSMIMVLTLMVYSVAEWKLRAKLKETGESIPNQVKKQTQKPTLKWVFMLMRGLRK